MAESGTGEGRGVATAPGDGPRRPSDVRTVADARVLARNRLIESRLTPNAISMVGLVGNLAAAATVVRLATARSFGPTPATA